MNNSDKSQKNSLKPKIWGPHGWKFMHFCIFRLSK